MEFFLMVATIATVVRCHDRKLFDKRDNQLFRVSMQRDVLDHMLFLKHRQINLDLYLRKKGYERVGIYGLSLLGNHIYEELRQSDYVTRMVGLDKREIYDNFEMEIFHPEEDFNPVDIIIVTVMSDYEEIVSMLRKKFTGEIISVQQIINECERLYYIEDV